VDVKLGLDKLNKLLLQVRAGGLIVIDNVLRHKKKVLDMP
jgi:predicted O-methyltransferase YrrM